MKKLHEQLVKQSKLYNHWHQHPRHNFFHFLIFIAIAILTATAVRGAINSSAEPDYSFVYVQTKSANQEIDRLTDQLVSGLKKYYTIPFPEKIVAIKELTQITAERRQMMLEEAASNPGHFLLKAFPSDFVKRLSSEIQPLVERQTEVRGKLTVFFVDNFDRNQSELVYELESEAPGPGVKYKLHFAKNPPALLSGSVVIARGVALDDKLVLASGGGADLQTVIAATASPTGEQRVLAMLVNFTDNTSQPWTIAQVYSVLFTASNSSNLYYQETSFGKTYLTGDVVGWFTIPYNSSLGCNYSTWASAANSAAQASGVNLSNYNRYAYIFPYLSSCSSWAGLGELGGNRTWYNGYNDNRNYAHELGHNFGMHHASSIRCGSKQIDVYSNCTVSEYGDFYDNMGSWNLFHNNGPHKSQVTWVTSSEIQSVTADGSYTVYPLEIGDASIKSIKIAKKDTGEYYYISYRQPIGFDQTLPSGIVSGGNVHIWGGSPQTKQIDTTPLTTTFSDAALTDGASFGDSLNSITVTQVSHDSIKATLAVSFGPVVCTKANPTVSVSPTSQTGKPGQALSYTVNVKNNDTAGCSNTTFNLTGDLPSGWSSGFLPTSLTLAPGASNNSTWQVTSASSTADGSYTITARVIDSSDNSHVGSGLATYLVSSIDTAPPVISSMSASSITASSAKITWITDEPADSQVEYGTTAAYGNLSPLDFTLVYNHSLTLVGLTKKTSYHYRVKSRDVAGNLTVSADRTFRTRPK